MRFAHMLSLATGVASTALNPLARLNLKHPSTLLPDVSSEPLDSSGRPTQSFAISDLYTESFVDSSSAYNRSLSFVFSDPNSNTSTICSKSWTDARNTSTAPFTYTLCDDTGIAETFQWQFTSYTSLQRFSIEFSHGWDDPIDFPPPYSYVNMFSTQNAFNLTCASNAAGLQHCTSPQKTYRAAVNAITN